MRICGIIAEYNPLHNGHIHHIRRAKELCSAEHIIVVMSSSFTQRGEAAIADKWARAKMALSAGASLVLELPVMYAVQPAQWFARAGIGILSRCGFVTDICFGAEHPQICELSLIAAALEHPSAEYTALLREHISSGLSYPVSQASALSQTLSGNSALSGERIREILSSPNDTLGIEYLRSIDALNSPLRPIAMQRVGDGYLSISPTSQYASAAAIRNLFQRGEDISRYVPAFTTEFMQQTVDPLAIDTMSLYAMRMQSAASAEKLPDMTEGLHLRILESARKCTSMQEAIKSATTRRYTSSRIARAFTQSLLGISAQDVHCVREAFPLYLRPLGVKKEALPLLTELAKAPEYIARPAAYAPSTPAHALLWQHELTATDVHAAALRLPAGRDFTVPLAVL